MAYNSQTLFHYWIHICCKMSALEVNIHSSPGETYIFLGRWRGSCEDGRLFINAATIHRRVPAGGIKGQLVLKKEWILSAYSIQYNSPLILILSWLSFYLTQVSTPPRSHTPTWLPPGPHEIPHTSLTSPRSPYQPFPGWRPHGYCFGRCPHG